MTHPRRSTALRSALLALTPLLASACLADGLRETNDFADVATAVRAAAAEHGAENVLLVSDIDNTLLAMNGDLGSDPWFEWQSHLLQNEPGSPYLVGRTFSELLTAQGLLFTLGTMRPPQDDLPELIAALQADGVRTLVLTSRGPEFRQQTERELRANGYDFAKSAAVLADPPCGVYAPYDLETGDLPGLSLEEAGLFGLAAPRGVSLSGGVFMTSGQHKGAMLLTALARCERSFQAVVFVDDHGRHVLRVADALSRRGVDATVFHYKREEDRVNRFRFGDKEEVARQWRRLDKTLGEVFD